MAWYKGRVPTVVLAALVGVLALAVFFGSFAPPNFGEVKLDGTLTCGDGWAQLITPFAFTCDTIAFKYYYCPWPTANIAFRTPVSFFAGLYCFFCMFATNRHYAFVHKLTVGCFVFATLMFAVGCIDANALRVGNGLCLANFDLGGQTVKVCPSGSPTCVPGRLLGMVFGDFFLSIFLCVLGFALQNVPIALAMARVSLATVAVPSADKASSSV